MRLLITSALLLSAATLGAQTTPAHTVSPGMSRDQVVAVLGQPLSAHSYAGHTYLLYANGCERTCGMNDVVTLDSGKVVDAIFRSPERHYTGTSSSPRMIPAAAARRGSPAPTPRSGAGPIHAVPAHPATKLKPATAPKLTPVHPAGRPTLPVPSSSATRSAATKASKPDSKKPIIH